MNEMLPASLSSSVPSWLLWMGEQLLGVTLKVIRGLMMAFDAPETISVVRTQVSQTTIVHLSYVFGVADVHEQSWYCSSINAH